MVEIFFYFKKQAGEKQLTDLYTYLQWNYQLNADNFHIFILCLIVFYNLYPLVDKYRVRAIVAKVKLI